MATLNPPGLPGVEVGVPEGSEAGYLAAGWTFHNAAPVTTGVVEADVAPAPPPRAGRGASAKAWRDYAGEAGVTVPSDASRDDVIAACELADVPTG